MDQDARIDKTSDVEMKKMEQKLVDKVAMGGAEKGDDLSEPAALAKYMDHTQLMPDALDSAFDKLCDEAKKWGFKSVCINGSRVKYCARLLQGTDVKLCAVIGFPLGQADSRVKAFEAQCCIEDGCNEIDMVINVGQLKSGNLKYVEDDIRTVKSAMRTDGLLKVIIETSLLTDEEKVLACQISKRAGADFVKTCTGFSGGGATPDDIALMRRTVGPEMGIKASGGVRNYPRAVQLIAAGANRLGAVSSVAIVTGQEGEGGY